MKNEIERLANLATYLDKHGHAEESHVVDHMLSSLAAKKPLQIGGKTYTDAASAWRDYSPATYSAYTMALGTGRTDSEGIKNALEAYFAPEQPAGSVPAGSEKTISQEIGKAWESFKNWPAKKLKEYQEKAVQQSVERQREEVPGYGRIVSKETIPEITQ
jgi:predicted glycoside hydrolase/deacetylase ChbG (UPF0249 family)